MAASSLTEVQAGVYKLKMQLDSVVDVRNSALQALRISLTKRGQELRTEWQKGFEDIAHIAVNAVSVYDGELTREDLNRAVEKAVACQQTALQERTRLREREAVRDGIGNAQFRLESAWKSFYVELDSIFPPLQEHTSVVSGDQAPSEAQMNPRSSFRDEVKREWDSAGLAGKIGLAFFGLLALPIGFAWSVAEHLKRDHFLQIMRADIDRRYRQSSSDSLRLWERQWTEQIRLAEELVASECNRRVGGIQQQLQNAMRLHGQAQKSIDKQMQDLDDMQRELTEASAILTRIKGGKLIAL